MGRASVLPPASAAAVPSRLGRLTATERRVWRAFPHGEHVDLGTGDTEVDAPAAADQWPADRSVRGEVIAALLLGACRPAVGAVAAVRLTGARVTGELRVDHGQISSLLLLRGCRFDGPINLDGAGTESIDLRGSQLTTLSAYGAQVRGTLDLGDVVVTGPAQAGQAAEGGRVIHAVQAEGVRIDGGLYAGRVDVTGSFSLINAQVGGQVTFVGAKLTNETANGHSLNAGGIRIGRSLLAHALETKGELRMPGAHIGSALYLRGAKLDGNGGSALYGDSLTVASEASFSSYLVKDRQGKMTERNFTAIGSVRLAGTSFGSGLDLRGAQLTPTAESPALDADRMVVAGTLQLTKGFATDGEIRLVGARITGQLELTGMAAGADALLTLYAATVEGGVSDEGKNDWWPNRLNLDGFTYGPFSVYREPELRLPLLKRQVRRSDAPNGEPPVESAGEPTADPSGDPTPGFRAQPYEQLAAYYRSLGNDGEARTVLLAKQRALRAKLPWWRRIPGHVIDLLVGYGYRPLRAIGWAGGLLAASSLYFNQVRPQHISAEDSSAFNPVLYAADHLIPVIRFGQPDVWQYHGAPAVITVVLTVLGWTLGIAIAAAATRTFTRN